VIEEARLERFLVEPSPVEPHLLGDLDVFDQRVVGGCSVEAVRVVALVEDETLKVGFTVEIDAVVPQCHRPETEVALDRVDGLAVDYQLEGLVVEVRLFGRPVVGLVDVEREGRMAAASRRCDIADRLPVEARRSVDLPVDEVAIERDIDMEGIILRVGLELEVVDVRLGHRFDPDGLPDTRDAGVTCPLRFILLALLSRGLNGRAGVVLGTDGDLVRSGFDGRRDIDAERRITAAMGPNRLTVDPHLRFVVDRTKVKFDPALGPRFRNVDLAAIPDGVHEIDGFDSGQLALWEERDRDIVV